MGKAARSVTSCSPRPCSASCAPIGGWRGRRCSCFRAAPPIRRTTRPCCMPPGRNAPRRRCGGTIDSMATSFSVGSPYTRTSTVEQQAGLEAQGRDLSSSASRRAPLALAPECRLPKAVPPCGPRNRPRSHAAFPRACPQGSVVRLCSWRSGPSCWLLSVIGIICVLREAA